PRQRGHSLHRDGGHVVVGRYVTHTTRRCQANAGDPAVLEVEARGAGTELELDSQPLEVDTPGRDPRVVCWTVEQPIDLRPRAGVIDPDLHTNHARRARAGTSRAHRHERAPRNAPE